MLLALLGQADAALLLVLLPVALDQLAISLSMARYSSELSSVGPLMIKGVRARRPGSNRPRRRWRSDARAAPSGERVAHVVAQIVEVEFVVGAVGDVAGIGAPALAIVETGDDHADLKAEHAIDGAHPARVTAAV